MDKLDLIVNKIDDLKDLQDVRLNAIDKNLEEHMRRTDILETLHQNNQTRIATLEKPAEALSLIKKSALYIAAIAGAILAVMKVLSMLKGV